MRTSSLVRSARSLAAWWPPLFGLWWVLVGEWSASDLAWGLACSFFAAGTGALVTGQGSVAGSTLGRWVRSAPSVAVAVVVDFAVVAGVLARCVATGRRGATGAFVERPAGAGPRDAATPALRSFLTVAATFSPNAYVVDLAPRTRVALLHDLRPRRSSERPA